MIDGVLARGGSAAVSALALVGLSVHGRTLAQVRDPRIRVRSHIRRLISIALVASVLLIASANSASAEPPPSASAGPISWQFDCVGHLQTLTVPAGVTGFLVTAAGGAGGAAVANTSPQPTGGPGGTTSAVVPVSPGEVVSIAVGCAGNGAMEDRLAGSRR